VAAGRARSSHAGPGSRRGIATFTAYSPSHLVVLALFAIGTIGLLTFGPRLRGSPAERSVAVWFAVANLVLGTISALQALVPFHVDSSLPLQICGFGWVVIAWALFSPRPTPTALTYYWGLTLAVQALLQPTLTQPFPQPEFFVFFLKHALMVWGAAYLTLVLRHGPDWSSYRRAVGWTLVWAVTVFVLNAVVGANYGYLNRKPTGTVLSYLGPWPVYVVAEMAIVMVGWALITLPWAGRPRRREITLS
jgi:hypothetical integral membrane protein (TIGR02206 family)